MVPFSWSGLVLELFLFSVDYSRSERLQFEDDEYYYYVKAIPKVAMTTPEKTVKKINERQETEIIDGSGKTFVAGYGGRRDKSHRSGSTCGTWTEKKKNGSRHTVLQITEVRYRSGQGQARKHSPKRTGTEKHDMKDVDKMLLTQSLEK